MENLAYSYIHLDEATMKLISFLLLVLGGFINFKMNKFVAPVGRAAYFFIFGTFIFIASLEGLLWLAAPSAIEADSLYIIVTAEFAAFTLLGYVFGFAATGRSLDAYGTSSKWWFAFVPLVNLILLFKGPINQLKSKPRWYWVRSTALVFAAFAFMMTGKGLSVAVENSVERNTARAANSNPKVAEKLSQALMQNSSIKDLLVVMAKELKTPLVVDEVTTLTKLSVSGNELIYHYALSGSINELPETFMKNLMKTFCSGALKPIIDKGATISAVYNANNGNEIGSVSVNSSVCRVF